MPSAFSVVNPFIAFRAFPASLRYAGQDAGQVVVPPRSVSFRAFRGESTTW